MAPDQTNNKNQAATRVANSDWPAASASVFANQMNQVSTRLLNSNQHSQKLSWPSFEQLESLTMLYEIFVLELKPERRFQTLIVANKRS
nr:hypothetical protein [Tanacetum cinerariifolium]